MKVHTAFIIAASLVIALLPQQAFCAHHKLFILTGQSNSLGTTNGGETDPTSGSDPADQHVIFSWHNVQSASTSLGHSGQTLGAPTTTADFTTLQDQQGGYYAGSATHWSGEMEFARSLYRAGVRDFGVIKASRGGGGNTNWHKASGGHMYQHILDTVGEAVASLPGGDTYEIVGLLYLQGESDGGGEIAVAGTRLKELTDNLRADLTNAGSMHTVAAGTTAAGAASMVNQAAIASTTSYIDFFSNTDLTSKLSPDGLHLNKEGKTIVGRRWAQAFLDAGITGISRHYGKLVFIGDSITQGGNGNPSYRYQVFKNLANAGVAKNSATGYEFVGSVTGAYQSNPGSTPDVNGQSFDNKHDGHWGWRAFWVNARVALPGGRYNTNNLGQGTVENWLGTAAPDDFATGNQGTIAYTGTNYTPDTVVMKIGINDTGSSSATQIRDDIATIIDQIRAGNANVRIHLCEILYSNNVASSSVDAVNALLPQLVTDKNTASSTSPVWLIDANNGFNPSTMTYDNTHPNSIGEEYVGDRVSGGLSIIELPFAANLPAKIAEKSSDTIGCYHFEGSDIYNSGSFASNWTTDGTLTPTPTGTSDLQLVHPSTDGRTLNGTNTGWSDINNSNWTFETRIKLNDVTNGYLLWLGTGADLIWVDIQPGLTRDLGGNSYSVSHNNHDGQFHTFKVTHDPTNSVYHLWRDDVLLTPPAGAPYDSGSNDSRLLMGDYTGGSYGDNYDVTIDYVEYCVGGKGNDIYNGTSYINNWSTVGTVTSSLVNTDDLRIQNPTTAGCWLEGQNTGWSANCSGDWTFEMVAKFDSVADGFIIWLETGSNAAQIAVYNDRTEDLGANTFSVSHTNNDGQYHTFRITHDANASVYHVFRDGVRLTDIDGVTYDTSTSNTRMILGDYTGGTFGANFDVTIDCINVDYSGVWIPVGTDTDADGMPDVWEDGYALDPTVDNAGGDNDGDGMSDLDEYTADTSPTDADSFFEVESITEVAADTWNVTVQNTSADRTYTLQESNDLGLVDTWTAVAGQGPTAGNGGNLVFADTSTTTKFYRVVVTIP